MKTITHFSQIKKEQVANLDQDDIMKPSIQFLTLSIAMAVLTVSQAKLGGSGMRHLQSGPCEICSDENKNKPEKLTLMYMSDGKNSDFQDPMQATCREGIYQIDTTIETTNANKVTEIISVEDGTVFEINGEFNSETVFVFGNGTSCFIQTSCSAPLVVGDQIGPFVVLGGNECKYETPSPSAQPTGTPSTVPTPGPSTSPSAQPTGTNSTIPTPGPSPSPSAQPTGTPSTIPTPGPSTSSSAQPTGTNSTIPTPGPSTSPSALPTGTPSTIPTPGPSTSPSAQPTGSPSAPAKGGKKGKRSNKKKGEKGEKEGAKTKKSGKGAVYGDADDDDNDDSVKDENEGAKRKSDKSYVYGDYDDDDNDNEFLPKE